MAFRRCAWCAISLLFVVHICSQPLDAQAITPVVGPEKIPAKFKSWSLFLVCNPAWLDPQKGPDFSELYTKYLGFGRAIGDDNAAVWFWRKPAYSITPDNVDVERSVRFCRAYNLKPSQSPYILVTYKYPDESAPKEKGDFAIFQLGNAPSPEITQILAKLTDDLLLGHKVQSPETAAPPNLFIRLLQSIQANNRDLGCRWTFSVKTAFITAEAKPQCQ